jgi:hypothetical protein
MPTFYLDDVGFTAQQVPLYSETAEEGHQPKPAQRNPRTAHLIYADETKNGWQNWSWNSTVELNSRDNPAQGHAAVHVEQQPGGALAFGRHDSVRTTGYTALEFYVHGGRNGGQRLAVILFDGDGKQLASVSVNNNKYTTGGQIPPNMWRQVYIPLRDLKAEGAAITKIAISNASRQATSYSVDAVSLVK